MAQDPIVFQCVYHPDTGEIEFAGEAADGYRCGTSVTRGGKMAKEKGVNAHDMIERKLMRIIDQLTKPPAQRGAPTFVDD